MLNQMHNIANPKKYPISISFPKGLDAVSVVQPLSNAKSGSYIMEVFKDIKGYEGCYQISNFGRVKSLLRKRVISCKILCPCKDYWGYYHVTLCKNNHKKTAKTYRLVGIAFIPNPKNKSEINHKDGNKLNNYIDNLEWVNHKENMQHASRLKLMATGEKSGMSKLTEKQVFGIRDKHKKGYSYVQLSKQYNVTPSNIRLIIINKIWKHLKKD